jgi:hypothetical protein
MHASHFLQTYILHGIGNGAHACKLGGSNSGAILASLGVLCFYYSRQDAVHLVRANLGLDIFSLGWIGS